MISETIKPDHASIYNVINEVSEKRYILPEFQRPFVWNIEQSKDLFDSLIRGIFIGAFMLAKPQFGLSCREIDIRPRAGRGSRLKLDSTYYNQKDFEVNKTYVVLDGQQRITSLYRVLTGYDKIYFVFKQPHELPAPNDEIISIEQIVDSLSIKKIPDSFCIELSDVYKCSTWDDDEIMQKLFDPIILDYDELSNNPGLKSRYFKLLLKLKRLFADLIKDKTLLSVFLLDMGIEKFCMFFERSNSRGTELNFIDIITAKIYKDFNLDQHVKLFKEQNKGVDFDNGIVESYVRYISFLKTGLVDKKTILTKLDGNDFNVYWNLVCDLYVKTCNYVVSQRLIYGANQIPNKTMFIPIIHLANNLPHKDFSQITPDQAKMLRFWFWGSLLNTRYGGGMVGSTNDIIVDDCKALAKIALKGMFEKEYLKQFKFKYEYQDLLDLSSNGAIFVGIMSVLNYKFQFKNLSNENVVDFKQPTNIHHIFPVNYFEKHFENDAFENENVHSVLNKMIIEKIPNIKFADNAPSVYLNKPEILQNKNNLVSSIQSHHIPNPLDLVNSNYDNSYRKFTEDRSELIIKTIQDELTTIKENLIENIEKGTP